MKIQRGVRHLSSMNVVNEIQRTNFISERCRREAGNEAARKIWTSHFSTLIYTMSCSSPGWVHRFVTKSLLQYIIWLKVPLTCTDNLCETDEWRVIVSAALFESQNLCFDLVRSVSIHYWVNLCKVFTDQRNYALIIKWYSVKS